MKKIQRFIFLFIVSLVVGCATPPPLPNFTNKDFLNSTSIISICKTPPNYIAPQMAPTLEILSKSKNSIKKNIPYRFPVNVGDEYIIGLFDKSHTQLHKEKWFSGRVISEEDTYILIKPKRLNAFSTLLQLTLPPGEIIARQRENYNPTTPKDATVGDLIGTGVLAFGADTIQDRENQKIKSQLSSQSNRVEVLDYGVARYVSKKEFEKLCPE